jgi:Arc/MetJ-type ribon-helix-helix transcriptional regulator
MPKLKKTIALDRDLYDWALEQIKTKKYSSLSHIIQYALVKLREGS